MNILIVDDNPTNLKLLHAQLEVEGHVVNQAYDGREAFAFLNRQPFDAVITDILMPNMDGYRLCHEIRKNQRLQNLPVIIYTATYTSPGDEKLAFEVGADEYLKKPASSETIAAALRKVISSPRMEPRVKVLEEADVLKEYSERLVVKLEKKNIELQTTKEELRRAHHLLRQLIEQIPAVIYSLKVDGERVIPEFVSENMTRLLGFTVEESCSFEWWAEHLHPEDKERQIASIPETLKRGQLTCEYRMRHKDGHYIWIEDMRQTTNDTTGKPASIYGVWTNIDARRTLEEQLRQSQKMEAFGQLAGGVAHDFNNMLAVILMQAGLLQTDKNLSPEHLENAVEITKAAKRASELTRQLLLFSRKETLRLRDLDLNQSISEMTKMLRRTLGEDIQLQFRFAMQSLFIHADPTMLDQVLLNLAVNARDAMPRGGSLIIETTAVDFDESIREQSANGCPGSFACLSVNDTGSGIPAEILPRIFEPFFTTKEVGKGTGLGLATVFGIVQQHQGWITVNSEVGRGTTFRIYVPRLASKSGKESAQPELTSMRGGNETILLVEDEVPVRATMRLALSRLGYRVLETVNGIEALKIWKQDHGEIHLLLTDLMMPGGMTGKELAEQLLRENPKLKVIYVSGYRAGIVAGNLQLEEGLNYLTKPFGVQKLAVTVRNCLDTI